MSDRQQRTIDFLDDQLGQANAQYAALRTQLVALVVNWQQQHCHPDAIRLLREIEVLLRPIAHAAAPEPPP
jgi:hypothetical protein